MTAFTDPTPTSDCEFGLRRMIHAPREKTFKAWIHPELLKKWFAPSPVVRLDVRADGANRIVLRHSEDKEPPKRGVRLEVVGNERLILTDASTSDWEPAVKPFISVTLSLDDEGSRTRYTARVRHRRVAEHEARAVELPEQRGA